MSHNPHKSDRSPPRTRRGTAGERSGSGRHRSGHHARGRRAGHGERAASAGPEGQGYAHLYEYCSDLALKLGALLVPVVLLALHARVVTGWLRTLSHWI